MNMREALSTKIHVLIFLIILILLGNTVWLTLRVRDLSRDSGFNIVNMSGPSDSIKEATPASTVRDSCYPYSCIDLIKQATSSSSPTTQPATKTTTTTSATKEFYIPFGDGETKSSEYEDIAGLEAYIDSTKYGKIKTVTFEASLRIPTANGRVYAQLYNVTDKHPVWFSEISAEGNKSQLVISSPITLDLGNKLYRVQMRTTLEYQSLLESARVHIITQ